MVFFSLLFLCMVKEFSIEGLQEKWFCVNMLRNVKRMFRKYYKNI